MRYLGASAPRTTAYESARFRVLFWLSVLAPSCRSSHRSTDVAQSLRHLAECLDKINSKTLTITGLALPYSWNGSSCSAAFTVRNNVPAGYNSTAIRGEVLSAGGSSGDGIEAIDNTGEPYSAGLFAYSAAGTAGSFYGNASVSGNLSKGGGSFKIDHPLDPENKYRYRSFVECRP